MSVRIDRHPSDRGPIVHCCLGSGEHGVAVAFVRGSEERDRIHGRCTSCLAACVGDRSVVVVDWPDGLARPEDADLLDWRARHIGA